MKLAPEQLQGHLSQPLLPVYLLSGDEPLLIQEAADLLRQQARSSGFSERETLHAESGFQWESLLEEANSLSLFADKRIIELHIPNGKPGPKGSDILATYLQSPAPDTLLLIYPPRLDGSAQKSKWFKAIDQAGATLTFWPIEFDRLPSWIQNRFRQAGLKATPEAAALLAERVEGNLLAAIQEIEKLRLQCDNQTVDEQLVLASVADSSRYDVFTLTDTALRGNPERCLKILQGLRAEGVEPPVVLWALSRDLRVIASLTSTGINDQALRKHRIFGKRGGYIKQAAGRLHPAQAARLLQRCATADNAIKGRGKEDPWLLLADIALGLASQPPQTPV